MKNRNNHLKIIGVIFLIGLFFAVIGGGLDTAFFGIFGLALVGYLVATKKYLKPISIVSVLLSIIYLIGGGDDWLAYVIFAIPVVIFIFDLLQKKKRKNSLPNVSEEKASHYHETGMTEHEVRFFRETMSTAKEQISRLETNMNDVAKLKAINLRNDTVLAAKALFKELVKEPKKLHLADRFLYTHLPNIVELTDRYLEINSHEIKTKETYDKLEESAQIIDSVSKLIALDYQKFVSDDLDGMDIEISIAKQSLSRDNKVTADDLSKSDTE